MNVGVLQFFAWPDRRVPIGTVYERVLERIEIMDRAGYAAVWLAASSDDSIARAAHDGFAILMDPHSAHEEIGRKLAVYADGLRGAGYDAVSREVPIARLVAIGDTAARAEEVARRGARWLSDSYVNAAAMAPAGKGTFMPFGEGDPVERYMNGVIIRGTADAVADELRRLEGELPLRSLLLAPLSEETFRRFTDDVLPRLAAAT